MIPSEYIWFVWSCILLGVWGVVYHRLRSHEQRRAMLNTSAWTALFGLTEPLFVPAYWNPPSLFNLALRTGFDIESIVYTFALAGIAASIYWAIFPVRLAAVPIAEQHRNRHHIHRVAIIAGPSIFLTIALLSPMNPIYAVYLGTGIGFLLTLYCRPDLTKKMLASAVIFTMIYFAYFWSLIAISSAGYVERVWNLPALSGILVAEVPLEELIFAFCVGLLWSSIYEHVTWRRNQSYHTGTHHS